MSPPNQPTILPTSQSAIEYMINPQSKKSTYLLNGFCIRTKFLVKIQILYSYFFFLFYFVYLLFKVYNSKS